MKNNKIPDLKHEIAGDNLYLMETFTDYKSATIQRLTPVKSDGSRDEERGLLFRGYLQVMSPKGPMPVSALLDAETLEEAVINYPEKMNTAFEDMVSVVQEKQKEMQEKQKEMQEKQKAMQKILKHKSKDLAKGVKTAISKQGGENSEQPESESEDSTE